MNEEWGLWVHTELQGGLEGQRTCSNSNSDNSAAAAGIDCVTGPGPNTSHNLFCWTLTSLWSEDDSGDDHQHYHFTDKESEPQYITCSHSKTQIEKISTHTPIHNLHPWAHGLWATKDWISSEPKGPMREIWGSWWNARLNEPRQWHSYHKKHVKLFQTVWSDGRFWACSPRHRIVICPT